MILDNKQIYNRLDKGRVGESIEFLPDQIRQVLEESRLIKIPKEYSKVTQVVINGMGGSNIGAGILKSAFGDQLKVPVTISPGYSVPAHVNKNTLYLISSYSGTTEEPLSTFNEAKKRGAKIMCITEDSKKSKLLKLMMKHNLPGYIFKPVENPSGQPRLGVGYTLFGIAVLLAKSGLFKISVRGIEDSIASMEIWTRELRVSSPTKINAAKKIALECYKKIPILVAAEHLVGNTRALRNQICESSKNYANYLPLPDLNHYAMEGLTHPASNKKNLMFVFFDSKLYHKRVQIRSQLTKQVVKKNNINFTSHELKGNDRITQAFELLQLGAWISYYLGILNKVNPVTIPYVDWFKEELNKK